MSLQFIETQKGKPAVLIGGYIFLKSLERGAKSYWKCSQSKQGSCQARCVITDGNLKSQTGSHNHTTDSAGVFKRQRITILKEASKNTHDIPSQIVAEAGVFPTTQQLTHTVQRTRKGASSAPSIPNSLTDLAIHGSYTKTLAGDDFLLFDSGPGDDRILLFSTTTNLKALSDCENWFADGTFKSSPHLFKQIFTHHGVKSERTLPLVYGLLPSKEQTSYNRFLTAMNNLALESQISLKPKSILTDFENGCLNAFESVFPMAERRGCYFHHSQCIWKKIQKHPNILAKYNDAADPDFALSLRSLPALAFVPTQDVVSSFDVLMDTKFFVDNEQLLEPLITYYEKTWIGARIGGRRREPLFPHSLWNCFQTTAIGNPRTNNSVEGWHRRFNTRIGMAHPTIWKLIDKIKEEQSVVELNLNQIVAGTPSQPRRKKYRELESRLLDIVEDYGNKSVEEYLEGIAHNIAFYD